jgi:hypothetical protein
MMSINPPSSAHNKEQTSLSGSIAVVGGSGNLGRFIVSSLLGSSTPHQKPQPVKILTRSASKIHQKSEQTTQLLKEFEEKGAEIIHVDYNNQTQLVQALQNVHTLISVVPPHALSIQFKIIVASQTAGVKRFFTSEYILDDLSLKDTQLDSWIRLRREVRSAVVENGMSLVVLSAGPCYETLIERVIGIKEFDGHVGVMKLHELGRIVAESVFLPLLNINNEGADEEDDEVQGFYLYVQGPAVNYQDVLKMKNNTLANHYQFKDMNSMKNSTINSKWNFEDQIGAWIEKGYFHTSKNAIGLFSVVPDPINIPQSRTSESPRSIDDIHDRNLCNTIESRKLKEGEGKRENTFETRSMKSKRRVRFRDSTGSGLAFPSLRRFWSDVLWQICKLKSNQVETKII